jgi:hypothetical protein
LPRYDEALLPLCAWEAGDRCRHLDPAARFLALPSGLFIKATCSFPRLAALPVHPGSHCHLGGWSKQTYFGTRPHSPSSHSVLILVEYKGSYWLTNSQMVRYQSTLCENPHIRLEVVKTPNPATLLLVDSGP